MRTYGKNFAYKKTVTFQQRQSRCATEWDIRIDVSDALTAENVINFIKENINDVQYVLVSGVEAPDIQPTQGCATKTQVGPWNGGANQHGSKELHVHVALVVQVPKNRTEVLRMVRGPRKMGDEYAAPRNNKFSYAGWIIHHAKPGYKREGEPGIRYENGDLPMDPYTTEWALKIDSILRKWGSDAMKQRFSGYTDLLRKNKIKERIEALQMQLEDHDVD
jgi:hypothetical protein